MDRKKKIIILASMGVAISAAATGFLLTRKKAPEAVAAPVVHEVEEGAEAKLWAGSLSKTLVRAVVQVDEKIQKLRESEETAERLSIENAHLRLRLEATQLNCHVGEGESRAKGIQSNLLTDTQTKIGRTLASISYKPPANLFPTQLYTLGVSYFKAQEDEKAAVIFTYLTNLDDYQAFKNAKTYLLTGVSWYRVDNHELADFYFDRALATPAVEDNLKSHAQARLWKGIVADRTGRHKDSQELLREILDNHPRSIEANWVNNGSRAIAREQRARKSRPEKGDAHGSAQHDSH